MAIDGRWSCRHGDDDLKERQQTDTDRAAGPHFQLLLLLLLLLLLFSRANDQSRLPVDNENDGLPYPILKEKNRAATDSSIVSTLEKMTIDSIIDNHLFVDELR